MWKAIGLAMQFLYQMNFKKKERKEPSKETQNLLKET